MAEHHSSQEPGTQPEAPGARPATGGRHRAYDGRHRTAGPDGLSVWATAQSTGPVQRKGRYVAESVKHPARMLPAIAAVLQIGPSPAAPRQKPAARNANRGGGS